MTHRTEWTSSGSDLAEARLQVHHALQLVAVGLGRSLMEPAPDDSHTSVLWDVGAARWYGPAIPGTPGFRGFLSPAGLEIGLLDGHADIAASLPLAGSHLMEALAWLRDEVDKRGGSSERVSLASHFEIPDHGVARGEPFPEPGPAHGELSERFGEAHELVETVRTVWPGASPVRTWPHHFDLGATLPVEGDRVSVGIGFSPGDEHYDEPYYYVSPFPYPPPAALPGLEGSGHWKTEPFVSAILTDSERSAAGGSWETVAGFLGRAVPAARDVAGQTADG